MSGGYRVFCHNSINENSGACAYYRLLLPIAMMEKLGLPIASIIDSASVPIPPAMRTSLFMESDFTVMYQQLHHLVLDQMKATKNFKVELDAEGQPHWPPTFVADTDDDLFNVMPLNTAYKSLGFKRWAFNTDEGTECEDGDEIGIAHPIELAEPEAAVFLDDKFPHPLPGARGDYKDERYVFGADGNWHKYFLLWKDGLNVNFSTNRTKLGVWRDIMRQANLITTTTPKCAAHIRREIGDDANIFVTPNAIDFSAYPEIDLRKHNKVRILWEGSACHHEGLWPLNDSLARVAAKYPEVEWVFFGAPYKWAWKHLPKSQLTHIPWCHYEAYKLRLSTIGHNIALAPLAPSIFNQSRSAIRWYENSAIWRPAAVLAQNTAAFEDEIQEGETGLLFNTPQEFEEKLSGLIEDAHLRDTLSSNAKDWIRTNREAGDIATKLFMKWVEVREGHKRTVPFGESVSNAEPVFQ